jgi:hypothetical protein
MAATVSIVPAGAVPAAGGAGAAPPMVVTANRCDAHFWIEMYERGKMIDTAGRLHTGFQCERCHDRVYPVLDALPTVAHDDLVDFSVTPVCTAWAKHRRNPANHTAPQSPPLSSELRRSTRHRKT